MRGRQGRRGRAKLSSALGTSDPRRGRNAQAEREPDITLGAGLRIDEQGKIAIDPIDNVRKTTGSGPIHVQFNKLIDALIERGLMKP